MRRAAAIDLSPNPNIKKKYFFIVKRNFSRDFKKIELDYEKQILFPEKQIWIQAKEISKVYNSLYQKLYSLLFASLFELWH